MLVEELSHDIVRTPADFPGPRFATFCRALLLPVLEAGMADTITPLLVYFLEWLREPRPYGEVMEAWRTSCPRQTVWEDATDAGFAVRRPRAGEAPLVELTERGRAFLAARQAQSARRGGGA
jgi:hypothetical protein